MKILVIGDSCLDEFIYGECNRICPEAPVPVFNPIGSPSISKGMAFNVYLNLKSLAPNWDIDIVTNPLDITKTRYVDSKTNQMLLRVDKNDTCQNISVDKLKNLGEYNAVIISDYNKGFLTEDNIEYLLLKYPISFIDSKKLFEDWVEPASFIKINESEYNKNNHNLDELDLDGQLIVTLGDKGVKWDNKIYPPAYKAEALDLSGAGDTFLASFAFAYLDGKSISQSINYAQGNSLKVIEKKGVAVI